MTTKTELLDERFLGLASAPKILNLGTRGPDAPSPGDLLCEIVKEQVARHGKESFVKLPDDTPLVADHSDVPALRREVPERDRGYDSDPSPAANLADEK